MHCIWMCACVVTAFFREIWFIDCSYTYYFKENPTSRRVYSHLVYFSKHQDEEVQLKAVTGLGKQHIHVEGEGTYWLVGAVLELISHDFISTQIMYVWWSKGECMITPVWLFFPGFFCVRYPELMLEKESKQLYHEWLTKDCHSKKKCQVRSGLQLHYK